ncbi:3-carboxymuconate cyclase [Thraustotheca clavata]|nr:3-carboxymuconate cyclase [Thraustotheca clavata]
MPTYMALSFDQKYLYLTNEVDNGQLVSFEIRRHGNNSIEMISLGKAPTNSKGPVHVAVTKDNRFVVVASYSVGSVTVMGVDNKGFAKNLVDHVEFSGGSHVVPGRQDGPHAHCIALSPDNNFLFVTDLGNDKVMQFKFDIATGKLSPNNPAFVSVRPGALPRHMAFHPNGKYLYLDTEQSNELIRYSYNSTTGTLQQLNKVKTTKTSGIFSAAVHVTKNGRYVLISNRYGQQDSIAVYSSNLKLVGNYPTVVGPRDFTIANDIVFVAGQDANGIDTFRLQSNGQLEHLAITQPFISKPQVLLPLN